MPRVYCQQMECNDKAPYLKQFFSKTLSPYRVDAEASVKVRRPVSTKCFGYLNYLDNFINLVKLSLHNLTEPRVYCQQLECKDNPTYLKQLFSKILSPYRFKAEAFLQVWSKPHQFIFSYKSKCIFIFASHSILFSVGASQPIYLFIYIILYTSIPTRFFVLDCFIQSYSDISSIFYSQVFTLLDAYARSIIILKFKISCLKYQTQKYNTNTSTINN